jgi:hypothetical protein
MAKKDNPPYDKIIKMREIILGVFPKCKIEVTKRENQYRTYLEFCIKIKKTKRYAEVAHKIMELHKRAYSQLKVKDRNFEYGFDVTEL